MKMMSRTAASVSALLIVRLALFAPHASTLDALAFDRSMVRFLDESVRYCIEFRGSVRDAMSVHFANARLALRAVIITALAIASRISRRISRRIVTADRAGAAPLSSTDSRACLRTHGAGQSEKSMRKYRMLNTAHA